MTYKELDCYRHIPPETVISVSGGRTSAYLLAHIVEANGGLPPGTVACFQNTGLELPQTLDFVHQLEEHLGVPIVWLERDNTQPNKVKEVDYASAARAGEPFVQLFTEVLPRRRDGTPGLRSLPHPSMRVCTAELKIGVADRYLRKNLGWKRPYYNALGFRYDEERRVERRVITDIFKPQNSKSIGVYPMFSAEVEADDVLDFWSNMPFDLQVASGEGNCDFCFMKSAWRIKDMMQKYPERVQRWIDLEEMERDRDNRFLKERPSMRELFEEVQAGNMRATETDLFCGTCTD